MVAGQHGDLTAARPVAPASDIKAPHAGVVTSIDVESIGYTIVAMGGGRRVLSDSVDHSVGLEMLVRTGDQVDQGQPLLRLFSEEPDRYADQLQAAFVLGTTAAPEPLIAERITGETP